MNSTFFSFFWSSSSSMMICGGGGGRIGWYKKDIVGELDIYHKIQVSSRKFSTKDRNIVWVLWVLWVFTGKNSSSSSM
jgi:hypothetical protein